MEDKRDDRYNLSPPWIGERQQHMKGPRPKEEPAFPEEQQHEYAFYGEPQRMPERWSGQGQRDVPQPAYMRKDETLSLLSTLKKYIIIGAILLFGFLSGLVVGHATGATANQQGPGPFFDSPAQHGPFDDHHFFHHRGGFEFGNDNPSQSPFSGSNVSGP